MPPSILVVDDDPVTLFVSPHGTVILGNSEGSFRWRTLESFDRCMESVDRQRAAHGFTRCFDEPLPLDPDRRAGVSREVPVPDR